MEMPNKGSIINVEGGHIRGVLTQTGWKIHGERGAAEILGMNLSTLQSRIKRLEIKRLAQL